MNKLYIRQETPLTGCFEVREAKLDEVKNALSESDVLELASEILKGKAVNSDPLTSPDAVRKYIQMTIGASEREEFMLMLLNSQNQIIHSEILFTGTIDSASIYPREVIKIVLKYNASSAFIAHNHPSGDVKASQADRRITRKLTDALTTVDVKLLDHFIVGPLQTLSFAEEGYI
ncbi:RadC family protein (plasmid) [Vibrio scophthalmi]|uniref:RadC family protein n=1 Tax=Vibrio scophthalmi TaxID=45658 RepID=UPI003EBF5B19